MAQKLRQTIESAVKSGQIGDNCTFVDLESSDDRGEDHYASDVVFAVIKVADSSSQTISLPVTIKRQQSNEFHRKEFDTAGQFYNEVLMYEEIIPFLEEGSCGDIFPKYIYGHATNGKSYEHDIVVVEDLRRKGYVPTKEKLFLDFEHCALALKKVAQFHSLSYRKKHNQLAEFIAKTSKLKNVTWAEKDQTSLDKNNHFFKITTERGIIPLQKEGLYENELNQLRESLKFPFEHMRELCQPEEPVAILCHGDFCRNNMLFKYDETGRPVDVKLIDVATARYASPAIDLSFFLLMNTSAELRDTRWGDLLQVYHEALTSYCSSSSCPVPSLDTIHKEFNKKMVYGYVICSFFIPMMMEASDDKGDETWSEKSQEELDELFGNSGGELATKYISQVARHILKLASV